MAPKRPVIEQPPPADSSSEEEQERSEENDAVEEDEDEENDAVEEGGEEEEESESPVKKSTVAASSSSSDDDDGSGSDSDDTQPSPTASDFTIKPIVTAKPPPIDDVTKPKKPASKPSTSATKSGSKRPAPEPEPDPIEPESKTKNKKKKVAAPAAAAASSNGGGGDDNEEAKKGSGNQRVWSEDDEVALLKGMSEYRTLKGSVPSADMSAFYEFIKKSMHFDLSKNQLVDKIRRLRKKYLNNVQKGEDPVFSKPHEHRAFVLSKKIWGAEANGNDGVVAADSGKSKKKAKQTRSGSNNGEVHTTSITLALPSGKNPVLNLEAKANGDGEAEAKAKANGGGGGDGGGEEVRVNNGDGEEKGDFWSNYPCLNGSLETGRVLALPEFGKSFLRERMSLIGNDKAEELEEKWRDLQEEELKLYLKRVDLVKQQAELALETLRASRS